MNNKINTLRIIAAITEPNLLSMESIDEFEKFANGKVKKIEKEWRSLDEATCWMKKSHFYEDLCMTMAKTILKIKNIQL